MSGTGREALPDIRECPSVVGRLSRMSGSGWQYLPDVRE